MPKGRTIRMWSALPLCATLLAAGAAPSPENDLEPIDSGLFGPVRLIARREVPIDTGN